jgi:hypothetical protein
MAKGTRRFDAAFTRALHMKKNNKEKVAYGHLQMILRHLMETPC